MGYGPHSKSFGDGLLWILAFSVVGALAMVAVFIWMICFLVRHI